MKIINKLKKYPSVTDYVNKVSPAAITIQEKYGLPAVALMAQIAQETGWLAHVLPVYENQSDAQNSGTPGFTPLKPSFDSKNLFNIKFVDGHIGKFGWAKVWEIVKGQKIWVVDRFCAYDDYNGSFEHYARAILNIPAYAECVKNAKNPEEYVKGLQRASYATDPKYAENIITIMGYFEVVN